MQNRGHMVQSYYVFWFCLFFYLFGAGIGIRRLLWFTILLLCSRFAVRFRLGGFGGAFARRAVLLVSGVVGQVMPH